MAKYLDLTGLSHYDQKIKQYIAQHGGGGTGLYKHQLYLYITDEDTPGNSQEINITFINKSSTPISVFSNVYNLFNSNTFFGLDSNLSLDDTSSYFTVLSANFESENNVLRIAYYDFNTHQIKGLSVPLDISTQYDHVWLSSFRDSVSSL